MKTWVFSFILILFTLFGQDSSKIRIGYSAEFLPALIKVVRPEYPPIAKQARVQGTVVFDATVTKRGEVDAESIVLVSKDAHFLLVEAAKASFVQWRYKPLRMNGKAVPAPIRVEFYFRLRPSEE